MDEDWTFTGILDKGWRSHEVGRGSTCARNLALLH